MKKSLMIPVLLCGVLGSCDSPTATPMECPQTYEFGNYGCAVLSIETVNPSDMPYFYSLNLSATPSRPGTGVAHAFIAKSAHGDERIGRTQLKVTRNFPPDAASQDTASFWITATISELPERTEFAVDSVLRVLRFSPVEGVVSVDSVTLHPVTN
jgi:hypothetical protein